MSSEACDIAVSEMAGIPAEEICGYILVTWTHPPEHPRKHALGVMPSNGDFKFAEAILARALADLQSRR